jgi:hypothetical protein
VGHEDETGRFALWFVLRFALRFVLWFALQFTRQRPSIGVSPCATGDPGPPRNPTTTPETGGSAMDSRSPEDPRPLIAIVVVAGVIFVSSHVATWLRALSVPAASPLLLVVPVVLGLVAVVARRAACRRALRRRARYALVPTDRFAPDVETVLRFASGLARARRTLGARFYAPASAVRVALDTDADGRLRYSVTVPEYATRALRTAAGAFGQDVELIAVDDDHHEDDDHDRVLEHARAELALARPSAEPLREVGVDPDPLTGFAHALDAAAATGTRAAVMLDLLPLTPAQARRERRRLIRGTSPSTGLAALVLGEPSRRRGRAAPGELVETGAQRRALTSKLGRPEPLFAIQVMARVASPIPGAAVDHLRGLLAAFDPFAGENHLRVLGRHLPGLFLGADMPWRRGRFDHRWTTGRFAPARRGLVTATEIAGLLKPPTTTCSAANVLRSGGAIPPPPRALPTFTGQRSVLPLGRVTIHGRERMVGVPLDSTLFSYMSGRSGWGKTNTAVGQFIHLVRSGHGGFFHDPHEDAIREILQFLTDAGMGDRVILVNLATFAGWQPGWNLFSVAGRSDERTARQVDAVVDAFAATLQWDERNTRALNLVTQSAQALVELARVLPAELAPTLFQVSTLLGNDEWRAAVLPHLSPVTREFFTNRFPRLPAGAITPVTNLIDRLRAAPAVAALFGSPTTTYDVRETMDRGMIVLACPGFGADRDRLVANLFVYDLLHAARTRASVPPERRRPFYVFLDEIQTHDGPSLAALLEQMRKFGLRGFLFNQNPERLSATTLNAVTTNRSHLSTTALNAKAAALVTREWAGALDPDVVTQLAKYTYLTSVTLGDDITRPFLVRGVSVDELHPDLRRPDDVPALEREIDERINRRPVGGDAGPARRTRRTDRRLPASRSPRRAAPDHGHRPGLADGKATPMSWPSGLPPVAVDALDSIHQHRALTARQLQVLHAPSSSLRWMQRVTASLTGHGLVDSVRVDRGRRLFFATAAGADAVALLGSRTEMRRTVIRPEQAAGPLRRHTQGVNDTGIAFVVVARERGDDCGPWSWRHEIAHPIGHAPGQHRSELLISDALLTYQRHDDGQTTFHYRLLELDRATMPVDDLAAKLVRYARLYRYTLPGDGAESAEPLWRSRYPAFPTVLVILANGTRRALEGRRSMLLALLAEEDVQDIRIDVCLLEDLMTGAVRTGRPQRAGARPPRRLARPMRRGGREP